MNLDLTSLISAIVLGTSAIAVSVNCEKTKSSKKTKIQKGGTGTAGTGTAGTGSDTLFEREFRSPTLFTNFREVSQSLPNWDPTNYKPNGLWYSCGSAWDDWAVE